VAKKLCLPLHTLRRKNLGEFRLSELEVAR